MTRAVWLIAISVAMVGASWSGTTSEQQSDPPLLPGLHGVEETAVRQYEASGARFIGPISLTFSVLRFDTIAHAQEAVPIMAARVAETFEAPNFDGSLQPASVRSLGDQASAQAGTFKLGEGKVEVNIAVVSFRRGRFVRVLSGYGRGDPLLELADIGERIEGRTSSMAAPPSTAALPTIAPDDGLRHGGMWDMLPTLEDIPEGFVLTLEGGSAPYSVSEQEDAPTPTPARAALKPTPPPPTRETTVAAVAAPTNGPMPKSLPTSTPSARRK
jgi:hypothetical protein